MHQQDFRPPSLGKADRRAMALSIEAALARRSSDVRTAGEGAAADDHAAGLWMERSTCGPVAMVRPCWLSLLPDDLLLPILSFVDEVDAALMGAPHVYRVPQYRARRLVLCIIRICILLCINTDNTRASTYTYYLPVLSVLRR